MGLEACIHKRPAQVSGGEQQRAAIARALATRPRALLADEPTGNLDAGNAAEVLSILRALTGAGLTIVMVTHNMALARQADRVVELAQPCGKADPRQSTG